MKVQLSVCLCVCSPAEQHSAHELNTNYMQGSTLTPACLPRGNKLCVQASGMANAFAQLGQ